jgi:hypothetical protein
MAVEVSIKVREVRTREERVAELNDKYRGHYDTALPQQWVDQVSSRTTINPVGHFVWLYDEVAKIFGRPYPLSDEGEGLIKRFPSLFSPTQAGS